jgi:hypothetical protein
MDVHAHLVSITQELQSVKNRVRNFIANNHWQTDGEWKESVLRSLLRRYIPASFDVGRGFVITENGCSAQIDILIYDNTKPTLYKDGDLVFVTADAVRAIIEVKTNLDMTGYKDAIDHLTKNAELIRSNRRNHKIKRRLFVGLFSYDTSIQDTRTKDILSVLQSTAGGKLYRVVNHVSLGPSIFVRFWGTKPGATGLIKDYNKWHIYVMKDLSPGYFINNILGRLADDSFYLNRALWFPLDKEIRRVDEADLESTPLSS